VSRVRGARGDSPPTHPDSGDATGLPAQEDLRGYETPGCRPLDADVDDQPCRPRLDIPQGPRERLAVARPGDLGKSTQAGSATSPLLSCTRWPPAAVVAGSDRAGGWTGSTGIARQGPPGRRDTHWRRCKLTDIVLGQDGDNDAAREVEAAAAHGGSCWSEAAERNFSEVPMARSRESARRRRTMP